MDRTAIDEKSKTFKRTLLRVNACIVAYDNPLVMLKASVQSVLNESTYINKLYFIDNSPSDRLRKHFEVSTHYLFSNKNLGFGKGNNIAMRHSIEEGVDYHLLVNPDVYFEPGVIETLVKFMDDNPDVGLVMPKITYPDGSTQYLCKLLPTPFDLIGRRFFSWGPFKKYVDRRNELFELRGTCYEKQIDVPVLSGSFMMIRTSVLQEVGLFDERYFMYLEDFDLCRRIGDVSRTTYYPKVSVVHEYKKGSYFNRRLFKHHMVSALKYFTKWGWFFDKTRADRNKKCLEDLKLLDS